MRWFDNIKTSNFRCNTPSLLLKCWHELETAIFFLLRLHVVEVESLHSEVQTAGRSGVEVHVWWMTFTVVTDGGGACVTYSAIGNSVHFFQRFFGTWITANHGANKQPSLTLKTIISGNCFSAFFRLASIAGMREWKVLLLKTCYYYKYAWLSFVNYWLAVAAHACMPPLCPSLSPSLYAGI